MNIILLLLQYFYYIILPVYFNVITNKCWILHIITVKNVKISIESKMII